MQIVQTAQDRRHSLGPRLHALRLNDNKRVCTQCEMNSKRPCERPVPTCRRPLARDDPYGLDSESYTAQRLEHASPEHLHATSRRLFIGPFPKGWLSSHRKSWYKSWLGLGNYSSRAATFSADVDSTRHHQLTGLLGPSTAAMYTVSLPQMEHPTEETIEGDIPTGEPEIEPATLAPADTSHGVANRPVAEQNPQPTAVASPKQHSGSAASGSPPRPKFLSEQSNFTLRRSSSSKVPDTFYTAPESRGTTRNNGQPLENPNTDVSPNSIETQWNADSTSETLLLPRTNPVNGSVPHEHLTRNLQREEPTHLEQEGIGNESRHQRLITRVASGIVRFNLEDNIGDRQRRIQSRLVGTSSEQGRTARQQRQASRSGEVLRAERMLVRIETTAKPVPDDFNENDSIKIDTKVISKWREFLVVCRQGHEDSVPFLLQFYKTRVIPRRQTSDMKKKCSHEIPVTRNYTRVNLFSTLDKTLVVWQPYKLGTRIFIMRPMSSAHSVEWYTFLRGALGWKPPSTLVVNIPDLDISLHLQNPFAHLGQSFGASDDVCATLLKTMKEERAIAPGIVKTCLDTLSQCSEWNKILSMWGKSVKMGLAWRRYDRLEWVQGANEQRMYGTIAMRTTHELELRPKQHYPTSAQPGTTACRLEEPRPTEGFLILLTSQRGRQTMLGKDFFKRLYFFTQDQYLCFCKPAKATPPAPPKLRAARGSHVFTSTEIRRELPIIYEVNPFPIEDGEIAWLLIGRKEYAKQHDAEAFAENRRAAKNATNTEGYINLCRVKEIRPVSSQYHEDEQNAHTGDIEYHGERPRLASGARNETKDDRSFEIVLEGGLVVKFRAYNAQARHEWVQSLTQLSEYWKARTKEDITLLKRVRRRNLKRLEIDEAQESSVGQFAEKWEVSKADASPELFHTCGMSGCRLIKMSGNLYRRPRRHGAFTKCSVLLIEGQLLIFRNSLRAWTGAELPQTHCTRQAVLDLRDCYVYSGIITSSDLLYQNQTLESNLPNQQSRPRIYTDDAWTSADEDTATCFVIWHATRKALFRGEHTDKDRIKRRRWRQVSALGVPGRSIVFKTRSRAERDMWVLAIATEIDRLQQREDLRIVEAS
ncbi:hypothetical protein LOZ61_005093 [Ophidiomyces ophidiicola]|nr:hypothetical protein LOZ61_005093 [Ophidiomyces ophidiicola]KAI2065588.1 hypothetical protein LOZ40_003967 [Ophidiomyces ophidiicola]KAI2206549.1 hypothetical protein LOZ16_004809 [Ophidiomyces ophidiicola]KAI2261937.1 hypothetical protein LOZ10_003563 [Ophidiomyces ophidiicola]KAI2430690.1 hypothetical protein LOZ30_004080 [Ophidiomyces ophidiicola]